MLRPLLSALVLLSSLARAAEPAPVELPPVCVEGARPVQELVHDRAAAGTVIDRDQFPQAGADLPQVLEQQPGLRVRRAGGPAETATLSIRGSTAEQVLVTLDGVPLNAAMGGPVDLSRLPVGNLERVEIYRGASPVGFGASAIGGVLALTTRRGSGRVLEATLGGGSFGAREGRVFGAQAGERWEWAAGVDYAGWQGGFPYEDDGGTRYDPSDDRTRTRRNNRFDQANALLKGSLTLGRRWRLSVMDWVFFRDQGLPGAGLYDTERASLRTVDNLLALRLEAQGLARGRASGDLIASLRVSQTRLADPLSEIGMSADDTRDLGLTPDLRATAFAQIAPWCDLTVQAAERVEVFRPSDAGVGGADSWRSLLTAGAEAGLFVAPLDLTVLPSGRLEWAEGRLSGATGPAEPGAARDHRVVAGSYRLALVNESLAGTQVSLSAGRALRLPSLFELFGDTGAVLGNPALDPERAWSVEGGVSHAFGWLPRPHRLRLEAHAFWARVEDLIQYVQTAQNVSRAANVDRASRWGIEATARADLFGHLRASGAYTFLRARNESDIAARAGKALPLRPASTWSARVEGYVADWAWVRELSLFTQAEWSAGNWLDDANLVWLSSRLRLDAGAAVEVRSWGGRVAFVARNLGDGQALDLVGYPVPGRSFHVSVSGRFPW